MRMGWIDALPGQDYMLDSYLHCQPGPFLYHALLIIHTSGNYISTSNLQFIKREPASQNRGFMRPSTQLIGRAQSPPTLLTPFLREQFCHRINLLEAGWMAVEEMQGIVVESAHKA